MGRIPCCEKDNVKRGQWTPEEDSKLSSYIAQHGTRNWRFIPKNAGLQRCGKSCRLRWTNYLRPDLKHGEFSDVEEQTIVKLHSIVGNRWSIIAAQLPGRTDNDVKNHWNTKLKKKLLGMGIDPVTHKPFSHLMAEIATTLEPPQVAHLADAALGCFKDEMLHLLTKKRVDLQLKQPNLELTYMHNSSTEQENKDVDSIENIKFDTSRIISQDQPPRYDMLQSNKPWESLGNGFERGQPSFSNGGDFPPWDHQSFCSGNSSCTAKGDELNGKIIEGDGEEFEVGKEMRNGSSNVFGSEGLLWDLPASEYDLMD